MNTLNGQHRESVDDAAAIMEAIAEVVSDPSEVQAIPLGACDTHEAATLRSKLEALISARTRFTPEDIQCGEEVSVDQGLAVEVRHRLDARIKSMPITGRFLLSKFTSDMQSDDPFAAAAAEIQSRLKLAAHSLKAVIEDPSTAYNFASDGDIYLGHAVRHWNLDTCGGCEGRGKNRCFACFGRGKNTCHMCSGTCETTCDAWGCVFGKKSCATCNGTGSVTREVGYTAYVTVNHSDGTSHNESQYRTRYETHTCTAYGCVYGKVICGRCHGTARVRCTTCNATGKVVCEPCHGTGDIGCAPCDGSGQTGTCTWVDVHSEQEYALSFMGEVDSRASEIDARAGVHGVAAETTELTFAQVDIDFDRRPELVTAVYSGFIRIAHLDAVCNQRDYHLVAYGKSLEWLDLDTMLESLLRADLESLRNALVNASGEGVFATSIETLANPLQQMVGSEINTEIVEATLSGAALDKLHVLISAEYVTQVHDSMLAALRQIYTRVAKGLAWRIPLVVAALGTCVGLLKGGGWAASIGLISIPVAAFILKRRVRSVLATALGGEQQGDRALSLIVKGRKHRFAQALVGVPLAALSALLLVLPTHGLRGQSGAVASPSVQAGTGVGPTQTEGGRSSADTGGAQAPGQAVSSALALWRQGQTAQARVILRAQAEAGNAQAYGPYAVSLMYDDVHHSLIDETPQLRAEALRWARRGVQRNPNDAVSLEAEGELLTSDWKHTPELSNGLPALKRAALLGNTDAMHLLGMLYGSGRYVKQDLNESRRWFAMSAGAGQAVDMYNLGLMDWYGYAAVRPDRVEAMRLWKQAAAQGEQRATRAVAQGHPPG